MAMAITVPRYTVDDLERFPDDGNRYELLDGVLLVTPSPNASHQVVAARIQSRLAAVLMWPGIAHVVGPGAVVLAPRTQLEPDILVYPARFAPTVEWPKVTEHWLAVEVLSRSSRIYDREFKRDAYLALGVREVWLVDREERHVEISADTGAHRVERQALRWQVPGTGTVVSIDLAEVFAGI